MSRRRTATGSPELGALVDDGFDEDAMIAMVLRCHLEVDRARVDSDSQRLEKYVAPGLLGRLGEAWRWRSRGFGTPALRPPRVRLVTLVNAYEHELAWCTAEVHAEGVSPLTGIGRSLTQPEYWTFRRHQDRWKLAAIDSTSEKPWHEASQLERGLDPALRSESVFELASADVPPGDGAAGVLTSSSNVDARDALRDLSLVDGRFSWHVLTHVIERVVVAWKAAAELGTEAPLLPFAEPPCAHALIELSQAGPDQIPRGLRLAEAEPLVVRERPAPARVSALVRLEADLPPRSRWNPFAPADNSGKPALRWILRMDAQRPGGWGVAHVALVAAPSI